MYPFRIQQPWTLPDIPTPIHQQSELGLEDRVAYTTAYSVQPCQIALGTGGAP